MKESICRFLPSKSYTGNIKTVHFVYETDFANMKQPFLRPIYYAHLVTSGEGTVRFAGTTKKLSPGTLFFFFPAVPYEIDASEDFRYIYISFMGSCVSTLFGELDISLERSVFDGFSHLTDIWMMAIARINHTNANILSESVLLYTLSFISGVKEDVPKNSENLFEMIVDYVDVHFQDPDISLKRVADVFSYTEKYLSHFFKKRMGVKFNSYINKLRLQHSHKLIAEGVTSVFEIAARCGYNDPLYFSKTFKKSTGISPREYIKKQNKSI